MQCIPKGYILPSAAITLRPKQLKWYQPQDTCPRTGDVVYGEVARIGEHSTLENVSGRIHKIHNGSRAVFVYGNRYAPDYYEGFVPDHTQEEADLLARSGMIGTVLLKNALRKDPTRIRVLGYVCGPNGRVLNTREHPVVKPKQTEKRKQRARMILVVGTAMNSGKSVAAAACCWALCSLGYRVRASKVTGTASLKDILHMNDAGAHPFTDFTHLGYPSTYRLQEDELVHIFNSLDLKYGNNPRNYWVVELADGIIQRETAILLSQPAVRSRIHRLIFCAQDAFGAIGGLRVLQERFGLVPDALSGVCTAAPLHLRELAEYSSLPVFNSADPDPHQMRSILLTTGQRKSFERAAAG